MLKFIATGMAFAFLAATPAVAQQLPSMTTQAPTIKRTPLQKFDVPEGTRETVMALAEIVPNVLIGKHTHPGPEVSYVLEGELVLMVQGQPDKTYKAGETFQIPGGTPHDAKSGPNGAKYWRPTWWRRANRSPRRHRRGEVARMSEATCGNGLAASCLGLVTPDVASGRLNRPEGSSGLRPKPPCASGTSPRRGA